MKYVLFDLDGTLVDTSEGILYSMKKALQILGIADMGTGKQMIGPPLKSVFMGYYGMDENRAEEATVIFRKFYNEDGKFLCQPYPGMENVLQQLRDAARVLVVATSKPTVFAKEILEYVRLDGYFEHIVGSNLDNTRSRKHEVIQHILDIYQVTQTDEVVMVGDKAQDLIGAAACHIHGIGVTFGFGSLNELEEQPHDAILSSPDELAVYFRGC